MRKRRQTILLLAVTCAACARPTPPVAARLVDQYRPDMVEGRAAESPPRPRTEWRFDGPSDMKPPTRGWEAGPGAADVTVKDGLLSGRATDDLPLLHLERKTGLDDRDTLHEVHVRLRVSDGSELALAYRDSEQVDMAEVVKLARELPWRLKTPILPGEMKTYVLDARTPGPPTSADIRHVFLRPTNVKDARFEIESIRFVFRKEHLGEVPSGVSWQGLSGIYRETLVSRSPETIRMSLKVPARPWLDLGVGTVEDGPVTFRVAVRPAGRGTDETLLEHTVTKPQRWEEAPVDLERFAGQDVTLSLTLASGQPGALGFWGAPAVRDRWRVSRSREGKAGRTPQGVILIWADTLRRDHLGIYGYARDTSPVLDGLARAGVLFRDCVSQGSWTKVSTPSLLTSLYPTSHTIKEFADRVPSAARTLAEVYRESGAATLSMSSILFTGRFTNLHQGFETVHEDRSLSDQNSSKTAREYVDRLLPWLDAHRDDPFFVFLHVSDPHDPYKPYAPYDTLFADGSRAEEHERQAKEARKFIRDPLLKLFGMPSFVELEDAKLDPRRYAAHDRDWYDGSIRAMDVEIGRLLERLRTLGLDARTLVAFIGDHGEEFLEHGRMFHGQSTYGELVGVPLILWGPSALPRGRIVEQTVETIDVMPTLLAISGLPLPHQAQGRSLLPLLATGSRRDVARADDAAWNRRPAISEKAKAIDPGAPPPRDTESYAIVSEGWKLIHNVERKAGDPEFELYNHAVDPLDQTDLSAEQPERVERLARELAAWRAHATAARLKPDAEGAQAMSKEDLERLRSLGYIQ